MYGFKKTHRPDRKIIFEFHFHELSEVLSHHNVHICPQLNINLNWIDQLTTSVNSLLPKSSLSSWVSLFIVLCTMKKNQRINYIAI